MKHLLPLLFFAVCFALPAQSGTVVDEIYARVGQDIITKSDYDREAKRLHDELSRRLQGEELEKRYAEQKKDLLNLMVDQKLLEQRAAELQLSVDDDVSAAVKRLREENNISDDQALDKALKGEGSSLEELRSDFRRRIVQQRILWNYVQSKVNITEEEMKSYYEKNKGEMVTEPVTRLTRFVVVNEQTPSETLKEVANQVLADIKAGKHLKTGDHPDLRVDETADFMRSEIDPKLVAILDQVPIAGTTDPVEIPSGWLLLKVEERRESQPIPFEDARARIYNVLLGQRADKYQKSFMEDLRKQSLVVIKQTPS